MAQFYTENGKRYECRFFTVRLRIYDFYWGLLLPDQNNAFWLIFGWFFFANFCKNVSILDTENGQRYEIRFSTVRLRICDFYWGLLLPDRNSDFWLISGWISANFCKSGSILDRENRKRYEFGFSTVRLRIYEFYWGLLLPDRNNDFWLISGWFVC